MKRKKILLWGGIVALLVFTALLFPKKADTCTKIDLSQPVYVTLHQLDAKSGATYTENMGQVLMEWENLRLQGPFSARRAWVGETVDLYVAQVTNDSTRHETIQIFRSEYGCWVNIGRCGYRVCGGREALDVFFQTF